MSEEILEFKNRLMRLEGPLPTDEMQLVRAKTREGLSRITESTIEFLSDKNTTDLQDVIGQPCTLVIETDADGTERYFTGHCVSVEYVGMYQGMNLFVAELRSWLWFLTRTRENRIFQEMSATDIITQIFGDYGFSDYIDDLRGTYVAREICVQYNESDYDFICRLMAQEGVYFYETSKNGSVKVHLADEGAAHADIDDATLDFYMPEDGYRRRGDHVFEFNESAEVTTGKVTHNDYDFLAPNSEQIKVNEIPKGTHQRKSYEFYHYPAGTRDSSAAEAFARVRMEAEAARHHRLRGMSNVRRMEVGHRFTLDKHRREALNQEYLVTEMTHYFQIETDYMADEASFGRKSIAGSTIRPDPDYRDTYRNEFEVIPSSVQFRAPFTVPWPAISGIQTAMVTGPEGEEVYVDEDARIRIQFHWDRLGEKNELSTCWVRCAMPWTGKNWGMIAIPRIGYEVVVQFEEGNPDRPIVTGMLYNGENKPPYALPENKTQTGMVTRSTLEGTTETFNELVFEDKKEHEFVRFQSERDYEQIIKNNATITIGLEHTDDGDLTQTIHRNKTETLNTGDHTFTVTDGNQTISIKKDHTETIEGKATQTITGDTEQTVSEGNFTQTVEQGDFTQTISAGDFTSDVEAGDVSRTVGAGNETVTLDAGDYELTATAGLVTIEAGTAIELKVGNNKIKIDTSGVTIEGLTVKITGETTAEMSSPTSKVEGQAMLTVKGGVVMIN